MSLSWTTFKSSSLNVPPCHPPFWPGSSRLHLYRTYHSFLPLALSFLPGETLSHVHLLNPSSPSSVHCVLSHFSHVRLFATPWTVAHQAPLSMGFSRQEYWSGLPFPSPGDLPNPGLPHCRQILNCLSHQGQPKIC